MTAVILAEHIATVSASKSTPIPESVRQMLQRVTLDAYGLMFSARNTDYIRAIESSCLDYGQSTAFGHGSRFTVQDAALINGTAIHGEDFDDTFEGTPVHVSSVIVPTILAIAEREELSPDQFVRSMAFGAELICRLALVAPTAVHRQGFHPTAILGAFGASLTASIAYGLSPKQTASALGIVGSMASGIIEYLAEGTWTKRMHPGWAASAGIKSAVMAKAGFQGPRTVFEGTHGLFKGFASNTIKPDFSHLESFGDKWISAGLAFKPYACGTMTQPFVDCALQAAKKLRPEEIKDIHAHVGEGTVHRLWEPLEEKRNPSTPYGAKFSVPYCIAIGLLDGKAGFAQGSMRYPLKLNCDSSQPERTPATTSPLNFSPLVGKKTAFCSTSASVARTQKRTKTSASPHRSKGHARQNKSLSQDKNFGFGKNSISQEMTKKDLVGLV